MFSLQLERGKYLRVTGGATVGEIICAYKTPVVGDVRDGMIIRLDETSDYCYAKAGDTYESIANRYGCNLEKIRRLNGNLPVYPTRRIWLGKLG